MKNTEITKSELQDLRINFAKGVDENNWELFVQTLAENVEVDYTDFGIPVATMTKIEVANLVKSAKKIGLKTQHYLSNYKYQENENDISGEVYVFARHFMPNADRMTAEAFDVNARYLDTYTHTNEGWKISKFKLSVGWMTGNPSSAFNL
jgi:hypothetical protein